jgi:uncharacterized protein with GYD domain
MQRRITRGERLPIYVMLTKLTSEGKKTLRTNPERIKEVNREVEEMGVKILAQYALLGPYDFVNILEAPDSETVSRVAVELGSRGTIETMTMAAVPVDKLIEVLKKE